MLAIKNVFWRMHDLLSKDQQRLDRPSLDVRAGELQLNPGTFKNASLSLPQVVATCPQSLIQSDCNSNRS